MSELHDARHLSFGDSLFLHLERKGMPLHVATLSVFEGKIPLEDCIRYVESKLPLIPRYRQRVVPAPMDVGLPAWQYDRKFDVRNHVREVPLPHGTEAALRAAASNILGNTMDRRRPLWDLTLFRGLKGNRTGVLARVHHSMADGISGVGLMTVLMDQSPDAPKIGKGKRIPAPTGGHRRQSVIQGLVDCCFDAVQRVLTVESQLLEMAQHLVATAEQGNGAVAPIEGNGSPVPRPDLERLLPELLTPAERLPFNVVCQGPQEFACAEIPLADLKAVKHACGATINDVVLAIVASAVRRYAQAHGVTVRGRNVRIVVPVSIRSRSEMNELGNRITFIPVTVPLDCRKQAGFVAATHRNVADLRSAHIGELVGLTGTLLGAIPAPLQAAIGRIASQLPLSVCNLICTNVPGPRTPLYLLGHQMLSCYPYVPIGGEMGMNCAVLTYNGTAYFGFTADIGAVPDVEVFPRFLRESFADLQKELGIRARVRKKARAARPATSAKPSPKSAAPVVGFPEKKEEGPHPDVLHAAIGA